MDKPQPRRLYWLFKIWEERRVQLTIRLKGSTTFPCKHISPSHIEHWYPT